MTEYDLELARRIDALLPAERVRAGSFAPACGRSSLRSVPGVTLTVGSAAVERYAAAWRETDAAARRTLLDTCWAEDGVFCDPLNRVEGRDGLSSLIGSFQAENPGARIDVVSGVDEHDGYLRFAWRMLAADGSVTVEGTDFGEVDGEGTLRRIVGFFGPLPT